MILAIFVEFNDETDLDWIRNKCVPAVEDEIDTAFDEERLDSSSAVVTWEAGDNWAQFGGNF